MHVRGFSSLPYLHSGERKKNTCTVRIVQAGSSTSAIPRKTQSANTVVLLFTGILVNQGMKFRSAIAPAYRYARVAQYLPEYW